MKDVAREGTLFPTRVGLNREHTQLQKGDQAIPHTRGVEPGNL